MISENKIIKNIKESMNELVNDLHNNKIDEVKVMERLSEAAFHNRSYKAYFYELFFIQALENNKIPRSSSLVGPLFNIIDIGEYLFQENYKEDGTRMKVLKILKLKKSIELYELFLIKVDEESHMYFKKGVNDSKYKKAQVSNVTFEIIKDMIDEELK